MNNATRKSKSLKLVEALFTATGIMALGSVVASGAAVGALVEGFKAAGKTVKDALAEESEKAVNNSEGTKDKSASDKANGTEETVVEEVSECEIVEN